jgi:hypothetical protein
MALVPEKTQVRILVTDDQGAHEEWIPLTDLMQLIASHTIQTLTAGAPETDADEPA